MREAVGDLFNNFSERLKTNNSIPGIRTGYDQLDWMIGGLRPGELVFLGGKPGVAESAFIASIVNNVLMREHGANGLKAPNNAIVYFDFEISSQRLITRIVSQGVRKAAVRLAGRQESEWSPRSAPIQDGPGSGAQLHALRRLRGVCAHGV